MCARAAPGDAPATAAGRRRFVLWNLFSLLTNPKEHPRRIRRRNLFTGSRRALPGSASGQRNADRPRALVCVTLPKSSGHLVFRTPRRGLPSCESLQVTLAWTPPQPISSAGRAGFCHKSVWTAARAKESIHPPPRSAPTAWLCRVRARFPEAPEPTGAPRLPNSNRT